MPLPGVGDEHPPDGRNDAHGDGEAAEAAAEAHPASCGGHPGFAGVAGLQGGGGQAAADADTPVVSAADGGNVHGPPDVGMVDAGEQAAAHDEPAAGVEDGDDAGQLLSGGEPPLDELGEQPPGGLDEADEAAAAEAAFGGRDLDDDELMPLNGAVGDLDQDVDAAIAAAAAAAAGGGGELEGAADDGNAELAAALAAEDADWERDAADLAAEKQAELERRQLAGEADGPVHPWRDVADALVSDFGAYTTVRQAAFDHLEDAHRGEPLRTVREQIKRQVKLFGGNSAPNNPRNRYPASYYICQRILGVDDLDKYEQHVCPAGCNYVFSYRTKREWKLHANRVAGPCECAVCRCALCGASRFEYLDGGKVAPALSCYFFDDTIRHMHLDPVWNRRVDEGRNRHDTAFWRSPSGQRALQALQASGTSDEV